MEENRHFASEKEVTTFRENLKKSNPKCNWGAKWAKEEDRSVGVLHVMRCHRPLGVMDRVKPDAGLRYAFEAYQRLESGEAARRIQADALRILMLAGA